MLSDPESCDVLIIGSGIAGLTAAWKLAKSNLKIIIITKKESKESNTNYAQGGIAAVVSKTDSFDSHIKDTLRAGDGLCKENVVRFVVESGPARIQELIDIGVDFTHREVGDLSLGKEGGHSKRRVLHAKDLTGREIERALLAYCKSFSNLEINENVLGIDLVQDDKGGIIGAMVYDQTHDNVIRIHSKKTILATGGASKVFMVTSNPDIATGDGIAMASRAGAQIANMEFTQFHPTCLYNPKARSSRFLLSEALRGEGAHLINKEGHRFVFQFDERGELSSRDIVARAIDSELKRSGDESVYLSMKHKDPEFVRQRFPGIHKRLCELGFDLTKEPIPVVPAAHYTCGGVLVDLNGKTNLDNLYCIGESAYTGLHGANRLASNSLLEAVVYAHQSANHILESGLEKQKDYDLIPKWRKIPEISLKESNESDDQILISQNWDEIRLTMTNYCGIVRSNKRLNRALRRIQIFKEEVDQYFNEYKLTPDLAELRNIIEIAELIVLSALGRKESRGIHYSIDYPEKVSENEKYVNILQRTTDRYIMTSKASLH